MDGRWYADLAQASNTVARLISATPTSPIRNALADANIHLMKAYDMAMDVGKEQTNEQ